MQAADSAQDEREDHGEERDREVGSGPVDQPCPDVATEVVRPEGVTPRRALEDVEEVLLARVVPRHDGSEDRQDHDPAEDRRSRDERRRPVPALAKASMLGDDRRLDGNGDVGHSKRTRGSRSAWTMSVIR